MWHAENIAELNRLVGRPWRDGAEGPVSFGCWGLVRHIQRRFYGRELPSIPYSSERVIQCARLITHEAGSLGTPMATPADGCGVIMGTQKLSTHVGVYVELDGGMVFHAHQVAGVVAEGVRTLGHARVEFLRFHEGAQCTPRP